MPGPYTNIESYIDHYGEYIPIREEHRQKVLAERNRGFVYLIFCDIGLHKIGVAKSVKARVKQLRVSLPPPLDVTLVHAIRCDDRRQLERELHQKYASARVRGEWFKLSSAQVEEIKAIAG